MRASFSSFEQWAIADAEIGVAELNGVGGKAAPYLWLPVRLNVSHKSLGPRDGLDIVSLNGRLWAETGFVSTALPSAINVILHKKTSELTNHLLNLEFPLDEIRVAALERFRAGSSLKLRLDAVLEITKLYAVAEPQPDAHRAVIAWANVQRHRLMLQAELLIPQDTWVSRVLPHVGYGVVHVIELPAVPLAACAALDHSFKSLQQAQELHKIGLYDDAVGKCRVAFEKFFEWVDQTGPDGKTRKIPRLAKSWEVKLGRAAYDWLNASMSALKDATNRSHHSPNVHYSQLESQMILAITTSLVAYAARTVEVGGKTT